MIENCGGGNKCHEQQLLLFTKSFISLCRQAIAKKWITFDTPILVTWYTLIFSVHCIWYRSNESLRIVFEPASLHRLWRTNNTQCRNTVTATHITDKVPNINSVTRDTLIFTIHTPLPFLPYHKASISAFLTRVILVHIDLVTHTSHYGNSVSCFTSEPKRKRQVTGNRCR